MLYRNKYMMPQRRLELYLAQLALRVSVGPLESSNTLRLTDFLFDPPPEETAPEVVTEEDLQEMKEFLNFKPRNTKPKG